MPNIVSPADANTLGLWVAGLIFVLGAAVFVIEYFYARKKKHLKDVMELMKKEEKSDE